MRRGQMVVRQTRRGWSRPLQVMENKRDKGALSCGEGEEDDAIAAAVIGEQHNSSPP